MKDEEKKAINFLKVMLRAKPDTIRLSRKKGIPAIETVLNLIQKQQAEIRQYEKALHDQIIEDYDMEIKLKDELEKQDKIIDLMANHIATTDSNLCQYLDITTKCKYYAGENKKTCDNYIKEYFKRKIQEEN